MFSVVSITNYNMIRERIKEAIQKQYPKDLRNKKGCYSRNDLAKIIKVSSGNFSRFLSGKITIPLKKLEHLFSLLKLEIKSKE